MKIKCENVVRCGNYACGHNDNGMCRKTVVALDSTGRCALQRNRNQGSVVQPAPIPEKEAVQFDFEKY